MTLYEAIYKRKSVRKFLQKPISPDCLAQLKGCDVMFNRINPEIGYQIDILDTFSGQKLKGLFRVQAPYYFVLSVEKTEGCMLEAGCIAEQIVLYMTLKGLGSCYQGGIHDVPLKLPSGYGVAIVIAFGLPDGVSYRDSMKAKRMNLNELCIFKEQVEEPVRTLLKAARLAPSAFNRQPWRFVVYNNRIHVFMKKNFYLDQSFSLKQLDIGIMAAHILIAAEEIWIDINMKPLEPITEMKFKNTNYVGSVILAN